MKVAVLYTELLEKHSSHEEISIIQDAKQVDAALISLGYETELIPFSLQDLTKTTRLLQAFQPDLVFNLVDEVDGVYELSYLPSGYLAALGFKYTGCSATALTLTTDKILTKEILVKNDLPTAPWLCYQNLDLPPILNCEFIVKHRYLDGSAGLDEQKIKLLPDGPELRKLLSENQALMAEQYIDGREFALPIFNYFGAIKVPGAAETVFNNYPPEMLRIVGSRSKWEVGTFEYENTIAKLSFSDEDQELISRLTVITKQCWEVLKLGSYARVDFRIDHKNQPWILEVNGNPSIAANDWLACTAEEVGITYSDLIKAIVEDSLKSTK